MKGVAALFLLAFAARHVWGAAFLRRHNVDVQLGVITYETQAFNPCIQHVQAKKGAARRFLLAWFAVGVAVGCIGLLGSMVLLAHQLLYSFTTLLSLLSTTEAVSEEVGVVTPMIPGLTVPTWSVTYIWSSIFVSVAFHELGHAVAAATHRIPTESVGIFLSVLLPGAYVRIEHDFSHLKPLQQLQIFFAGVWHNFVLCIAASSILRLLPYMLFIVYDGGKGVTVTGIPPQSALNSHLTVGDTIVAVDEIEVFDAASWRLALSTPSTASYSTSPFIADGEQWGYCVASADVERAKEGVGVACCAPGDEGASSRGLCFYSTRNSSHSHRDSVISSSSGGGSSGGSSSSSSRSSSSSSSSRSSSSGTQEWCLTARQVVHSAFSKQSNRSMCQVAADCAEDGVQRLCLVPRLEGRQRLFRLAVAVGGSEVGGAATETDNSAAPGSSSGSFSSSSSSSGPHSGHSEVLFVGEAADLVASLSLGAHRLRAWLQPLLSVPAATMGASNADRTLLAAALQMPAALERLLHFLWHISASQALINAAPVYMLDGHHACLQLMAILFPNDQKKSRWYARILLGSGSAVLCANVVAGTSIWACKQLSAN